MIALSTESPNEGHVQLVTSVSFIPNVDKPCG